jgi:outer membrane protein assembly factor BamB
LRRVAGGAPGNDPWWRRLWREHPTLVGAGIVVVVAAVGLVGYLLLKRPGDVSDPDAAFDASAEQEDTNREFNWPLYGFNPERTRFLPAGLVHPPFKVKWRFNARKLVEYSPIVVDGVLYGINNNGEAFALDARTGKVKWRRQVAGLNASAPSYFEGRIYLSNLEPGQVQALDARTGRTVWRRALPGRTESSPVIAQGKVVVGCECGSVFALGQDTGRVIWETEVGGAIKGAPALEGGVLYVGAYGGTVAAIRLRGGGVKWTSGSQGGGISGSGNFYATPTVAFDRVYIGNTDGRMYSFEKDTGHLAWSQSTGDYVYAAAVAADTTDTRPSVYFGSYDGTFYALDARSGDVRWQREAGGSVSGAGSLIGHTVYVANLAKTRTIGFNVKNGKRVFAFKDGAYNPVVSDGRLLYVTGYKQVYALKPTDQTRGKGVYGRVLGKPHLDARPPRKQGKQGQGG